MRTAASRLGSILRSARAAGARSYAAEAAPAVASSDIGYVAQVCAFHRWWSAVGSVWLLGTTVATHTRVENAGSGVSDARGGLLMPWCLLPCICAGHRPCRGRALRWRAAGYHECSGGQYEFTSSSLSQQQQQIKALPHSVCRLLLLSGGGVATPGARPQHPAGAGSGTAHG